MNQQEYLFVVEAEDEAIGAQATRSLLGQMEETEGVVEVSRQKLTESTMDLGSILSIVMTSAATVAIAQGLADWLRRTKAASIKIERDAKSGSIKAEVENIDPATALRITEIIRGE